VATDNSGNTTTCSYTVTVNDNENPIFVVSCLVVGDQDVNTDDGSDVYTHSGTSWDITATDNHYVETISWTLSGATQGEGLTSLDGVAFNIGTTTVDWVVSDSSGNFVTCNYLVQVTDIEAP
jgi:hypothetical protein